MEEVQKNETGVTVLETDGRPQKEEKPKRELTPQQAQQRKKMIVFPLMFLAFAGCMYLIFAPSSNDGTQREEVGGFNADIPLPTEDGIIEKMKTLQDFGFTLGEQQQAAELELIPESEEEKPQNSGGSAYRGSVSSVRASADAYRNINQQLSTFYETPKEDKEKEELKRQVEELTAQLEDKEKASIGVDDQMAILEKSYELAAKYNLNGEQNGQVAQVTPAGTITQKPQAYPVQTVRENTVSGLQQPMNDADFIRAYSQNRNYGFNTAVGTGYAMGKNTIAACIHQDQTLTDGQTVKLRLLEPLQAGNVLVAKNTVVSGTVKVQGERLDVLVSSIEYAGNIIPVELAVFDTDGQKGLSVPSSMEQEAFNEAMANIGSGLGTSISFARSAGQQVAMDVTRGLLQGTSGYLAKKFRTVKVKLKAGYKVMLYAKQQ